MASAVTGSSDVAITFEESGERVYAAMLKVFAGCCAFIICISLLLPSLLGPLPSPFTLHFPLPSHSSPPPLSQHVHTLHMCQTLFLTFLTSLCSHNHRMVPTGSSSTLPLSTGVWSVTRPVPWSVSVEPSTLPRPAPGMWDILVLPTSYTSKRS